MPLEANQTIWSGTHGTDFYVTLSGLVSNSRWPPDSTTACSVPQEAVSEAASEGGVSPNASSASRPTEVIDIVLHFLGVMVPHHEQAVPMSDIIRVVDWIFDGTRDLVLRIKNRQEEIDQMNEWAYIWRCYFCSSCTFTMGRSS